MVPRTLTSPSTLCRSPRIACSKDDLPDPTRPTMQLSSPLRAEKLIFESVCFELREPQVKEACCTFTLSCPSSVAAGRDSTASFWISPAVRNDFSLLAATVDSTTEVMMLGSCVSGWVRRLKRVSAGNTKSTERGVLFTTTYSVNVAQDTRNGVVFQQKRDAA